MKTLLFCALVVSGTLCVVRAQAPPPHMPPTLPPESTNLPLQKLGADDLVGISVYDAPELTRTVRVSSDGAIRLPMLRQRILIAGLLPAEVETSIAEALTREGIMVDPIVTVSIVESRSRPISVAGAVRQPVTFQASGVVTLFDALNRAGGLSAEAGPEILVSRTQPGPDGNSISLTQRITVQGLIDEANPELNVRLFGGEQIRVPDAGKVYVVGNVKRPGAFAIRDASETTVLKALALAEGLTPYAGQRAFIYRLEGGSGGRNEIPVELHKILQRKSPDVPLLANDVLYITDRTGRRALARALEIVGGGVGGALIYTTTR